MKIDIHGVELIEHDDMVVRSYLNNNGNFEDETFAYFQDFIDIVKEKFADEPIVADIGAYTGIYSIYAAKQGCNVYAFEPNPAVYDRLEQNIDNNDVDVWVHNLALSEEAGFVNLNVNPAVLLTSGGSLESTITRNKKPIRVKVERYDGEFPAPHITKIDVEGHELSVLRGMKESLLINRGFVIVEANDEDHKRKLIDWFEDVVKFPYIGTFDTRNLIFCGGFNQ